MERVCYRFDIPDSDPVVVTLDFDPRTYLLEVPALVERAPWMDINCHKCPNCTLPPETRYCPTAVGLADFLPDFTSRLSHERVHVVVETANRTIHSKTSLQAGLASLIGLISATSGCPRTRFLRPLARFHLPFADERETLFRVFSSWLLTSYVHQRLVGRQAPQSMDGLKRLYEELSVVNASLAQRLRTVASRDALLNAIIILDSFAQMAPVNIEGQLEDILACLVIEQ